MRRMHALIPIALVTVLASCRDGSSTSIEPLPPVGNSDGPASRLTLTVVPGRPMFVGMRARIAIEARDSQGNTLHTDQSVVTSANPAVAALGAPQVFSERDIKGKTTRHRWPVLYLTGAGETTIRITVGNATDSVVVRVAPDPPITAAVVVDSFTVVEFGVPCATACPYLAYVPILKLRPLADGPAFEAIGMEFVVGTEKIGMCSGSLWLTPGISTHMNRFDPYLWANDVLIASLPGIPLPDGPVHARVIVREPNGTVSQVTAVGAIQRMVVNPRFPSPVDGSYWEC